MKKIVLSIFIIFLVNCQIFSQGIPWEKFEELVEKAFFTEAGEKIFNQMENDNYFFSWSKYDGGLVQIAKGGSFFYNLSQAGIQSAEMTWVQVFYKTGIFGVLIEPADEDVVAKMLFKRGQRFDCIFQNQSGKKIYLGATIQSAHYDTSGEFQIAFDSDIKLTQIFTGGDKWIVYINSKSYPWVGTLWMYGNLEY